MQNQEYILKGISLSPGIAIAKVCLFDEGRHNNLPVYHIAPEDIEFHITRFEQALSDVTEKLNRLNIDVSKKIGSNEAQIFSAQSLIVNDPSIKEKVITIIKDQLFNTEKAIADSYQYFEEKLKAIENEYLNQRTSDLTEIKKRLLDALASKEASLKCTGEKHCKAGENRIIVARELTPSLTVELSPEQTKGFLTEHGGIASHAAILARAMDIPAVSALPSIHNRLYCGKTVIIDGFKGLAIINPTDKTKEKYKQAPTPCAAISTPIPPVKGLRVMANINSIKGAQSAKTNLSEGIGLYRTEFEFIIAERFLNEEEQFAKYSEISALFSDQQVYFRAADFGGDKMAAFVNKIEEKNPGLGFRGSRLLLKEKRIFRSQARALARLSQSRTTYIMYPMISDALQLNQMISFFKEATADINKQDIKHGLMFEVPAACLQAEEIMKTADFASIGTNDLTQYLLAVDRDNELVAEDFNPTHPVLFSLIKDIAKYAKKFNKPLSLCGEIAGRADILQLLIKNGVDTISINPKRIPCIRDAFSKIKNTN